MSVSLPVAAPRGLSVPRWAALVDWRKLDRLMLAGCLTAGVIFGIGQATGMIADPYDARAYWEADPANLYLPHWIGGYVYPPPMALLLSPFHSVGWPLFIVAFTTATWAAFWYCTRAWAPVVILASHAVSPFIGPQVIGYLFLGNIQLIMAAAIVASIRQSAVWTIVPHLTKGVGVPLVWFLVRREWTNVAIAFGATAAIIGVTFLVAPGTWLAFAQFASDNASASPIPLVPVPLPVRLVAAAVLVTWGGLTNRRWTVMIAAGIAIPALYPWSFLAVWIGAIGIEWRPSTGPLRTPTKPRRWFVRRFPAGPPQPAAATSDGRTVRAPSS